MALYAAGGNRPRIHPTTFVHPQASVIGRVAIGPGCYIGPGASLRGDWVTIRVGAGSNVQDSCAVHGPVGGVCVLGEAVHLGHGCVVHGARVERNVLVGMGALIQDGAVLGEDAIVGAGCLVPAGMHVPAGHLVIGVPGRVVGPVRPEVAERKAEGTGWYQRLAPACLADLVEVAPSECLTEDVDGGGWVSWIGDDDADPV